MLIKEMYPPFKLTQTVSHVFLGRDGQEITETEEVLVEHMIEVFINGKLTMKLVCIPENLAEMVLGRLLSEGIIENSADVEALTIDESGTRADVVLAPESDSAAPVQTSQKTVPTIKNKSEDFEEQAEDFEEQAPDSEAQAPDSEAQAPDSEAQATDFVEITPSACTSNHILNDYFVKYKDTPVLTSIPWKKEWIFALADKFAAGMPIHSKTWSTHSAFLAMNDQILFECEDIGRHNALDKAIGYAIRNKVDLKKCILYSSGRVPTDMVMKVIHAGVPIFASKASLTREAIELAKKYNLTLICAARRDRMKFYAGQAPEDE